MYKNEEVIKAGDVVRILEVIYMEVKQLFWEERGRVK